MALSARLDLRQGQGLVVTPQLRQAISLLQFNNLELEAFIALELERNPLLQRDEAPAEPGPARSETAPGDPRAGAPEHDLRASWSAGTGGGGAPLTEMLERSMARPRTLSEHLEGQAVLARLTLPDRAIASALIGAVDEAGYLRGDLDEIGERLGCGRARVEAVLGRLQGFEPVGVFARDVRECLMLQLKDRDRCDPAMTALLDNLSLLSRRDYAGLRRLCGVDADDLNEMIAELRGLTPRPGAAFGAEPAQPLIPDVFVRAGDDGLWRVELNAETLPRLLVDRSYHAVVSALARSERERTFVSDCLAQAHWLVRSLDQRARTVLKVASEIVRRQDDFLAYGVERLRPLTLKTVADAIGMHESTVSRASANKVLQTPRGVFEMGFFFTSSLAAGAGGEGHSPESVRHRIKQLIEAEPAAAGVLSDDRIADLLKAAGVDIARRTVAKYRESMQIPPSAERRRQQAALF
jgi:RNA polymerase sigma-54 factor